MALALLESLYGHKSKIDFFFWLANKKKNLHSSVITVRQSLILCWKQWCRLSFPYPVLLVSGCLAYGRWGTRNGCWRCTAEHPHRQWVVRKLCWTWIKKSFSKSKTQAVLRDLHLKDCLVLVVTTNQKILICCKLLTDIPVLQYVYIWPFYKSTCGLLSFKETHFSPVDEGLSSQAHTGVCLW